MMLFRKSKVLKILKEYSRIYDQVIPDEVYGREELEAIKQIELQQLALAYDALNGYTYYRESLDGIELNVHNHMPDYSSYTPSIKYCNDVQKLARQIRVFKNVKFLQRNEFISDQIARNDVVFVASGGKKWKYPLLRCTNKYWSQ